MSLSRDQNGQDQERQRGAGASRSWTGAVNVTSGAAIQGNISAERDVVFSELPNTQSLQFRRTDVKKFTIHNSATKESFMTSF